MTADLITLCVDYTLLIFSCPALQHGLEFGCDAINGHEGNPAVALCEQYGVALKPLRGSRAMRGGLSRLQLYGKDGKIPAPDRDTAHVLYDRVWKQIRSLDADQQAAGARMNESVCEVHRCQSW